MKRGLDWKKYAAVFLITLGVFLTALYISNMFSENRVAQLRAIEEKIAIDLLSSETQYDLLQETACDEVTTSMLSHQLNELARKLEYSEANIGQANEEVTRLKKYYSLLEIKDYLLMRKLNEKCGVESTFILYFYSNTGDCTECEKMGSVLTYLRQKYPTLRVYSFDYHIALSAVNTLISIYEIQEKALPAVVLDDKVTYGYQTIEEIEALLPDSVKKQAADESATSSVEKSNTKETRR